MNTKIVRLVSKYKKKRARYYRDGVKATKRKDFEGQLVYTALQLAYTEMQTDLERIIASEKLKAEFNR